WAPDYPFGIQDEEARRDDEELERTWGTREATLATAQALAPSAPPEEQQALATAIRQSASPGAVVALSRMNRESDVRDVLPAIRFTDIVGSTAKAVELGDARWRQLLEDHHSTVRRLLLRYRGTELDTAGDGFFAAFDGPARGIRCARAITESVRDLGIEV